MNQIETSQERVEIFSLLSGLSELYPDFNQWLTRTLDSVGQGTVFCNTVRQGSDLAGVLIWRRKSSMKSKLCTLLVHSDLRGLGLGQHLVHGCLVQMLGLEVSEVFATAPEGSSVTGFLQKFFGFRVLTKVQDRYGAGRHELIMVKVIH